MDIRPHIVERIQELNIPASVEVASGRFTEATMKRYSTRKTVSLLVAVLAIRVAAHEDSGVIGYRQQPVVYVIASDIQQDARDSMALDAIEPVINSLLANDNIERASINSQNLYSYTVGNRNVAIWSIQWTEWTPIQSGQEVGATRGVIDFSHQENGLHTTDFYQQEQSR